MFVERVRLLRGLCELAHDVVKVDAVPAFGHLSIYKSAAGMDVEANLPSRRWYPHKRFPRVGGADIESCLDNVVSLETHGGHKNMFVGNGCANLSSEYLEPFRPARISDRFQFVKA